MSKFHKDVIFCKSSGDESSDRGKYVQIFTSAGYNCSTLTTLSFEFVNISKLREYLMQPESYQGLILTSPRSVEAINHAIHGEINDLWKKLPAYCVGPTTETLAKNYLKLENCEGSHCGNAEELANYIVKNYKVMNKSLLYPCSAIARDTLPRVLRKAEIQIEQIIVYESQPAPTLGEELSRIVNKLPQIFVFFSPSAVKYIIEKAHECSILLDKIESVAIGPVTAEALNNVGLHVYATANKPDPSALLQAIKSIGDKKIGNND